MPSTSARTIKPCPFCDGEGEAGHTAVWWVRCDNCGADGPTRDTEAEAVIAWNDRETVLDGIADPAAVLAEVRAAYAEAAACHTLTNRLCAALALLTPTEPR